MPVTSQIPRLTAAQYDRTVRDLLGVTRLTAASNVAPSALLATDQPGAITDVAWAGYKTVADMIATQVVADADLRKNFLKCTPEAGDSTCFHDTIIDFGRRAFRRPLTDAEVARFETVIAKGAQITETGAPEELAQTLLYLFLISPSFLQRSERTETSDGAGHVALSSAEVAQRLSYMLWGSTPDAELDRAADAGELAMPAQILAQATRMLADPRARDRVADFHRRYLQLENGGYWENIRHDTAVYPAFTPDLVPAMVAETERFFDSIVFAKGTFRDLLVSPKAFVNARTAPLYGVEVSGLTPDELTEVELDPEQRPGFLTRLGFLNAFSSYARTSPIRRGAFVTRQVLGIPIPVPPPGADSTPVPTSMDLTNRQQVDALTSPATCTACHHTYVNPPGFVLEAYDGIGSWQTLDPATGTPVDLEADVMLDADHSVHVTSPAELMNAIADSAGAQRTYASRWASFAYERDPAPSDACTVDAITAKMATGNYSILELIADLTQAESFRLRVAGTGAR